MVLFAMQGASLERQLLSDFDYDLPEELIAQAPVPERDRSRLLVLDRASGSMSHRTFSDLPGLLAPGDVLVLNDTRVVPCRLAARKPGGGKAELFLLEERGANLWTALVKGGVDRGGKVTVASGVEAEVVGVGADGLREVRFTGTPDIRALLAGIGRVPLPLYIRRDPGADDRERYQTVYASRDGAVAAPTAGLHFTLSLLDRLRSTGVVTATVTLHVGAGTFRPVRSEDVTLHRMHPERYAVPQEAAEEIVRARGEGRRVIAVGTTAVRALETAAGGGAVAAGEGTTDLFILPGFRFQAVDGLITNFHLPRSTLLMLVAAFAGRERTLTAYREAVRERYRFYSYGDAMLVL
jgi:S-adenosylmethionine:tRNA ribosyltransferase-isomerase